MDECPVAIDSERIRATLAELQARGAAIPDWAYDVSIHRNVHGAMYTIYWVEYYRMVEDLRIREWPDGPKP